jgi:hypothetical protein
MSPQQVSELLLRLFSEAGDGLVLEFGAHPERSTAGSGEGRGFSNG